MLAATCVHKSGLRWKHLPVRFPAPVNFSALSRLTSLTAQSTSRAFPPPESARSCLLSGQGHTWQRRRAHIASRPASPSSWGPCPCPNEATSTPSRPRGRTRGRPCDSGHLDLRHNDLLCPGSLASRTPRAHGLSNEAQLLLQVTLSIKRSLSKRCGGGSRHMQAKGNLASFAFLGILALHCLLRKVAAHTFPLIKKEERRSGHLQMDHTNADVRNLCCPHVCTLRM